MSEHIVHTAIVDDCLVLIQRSTALHPAFATVTKAHAEIARLGGITRFGDRHNPRLLADLRTVERIQDDTQAATRLAFVIGWLSHRAADRNFKQVFRRLDPDCARKPPTDCSVYHDVAALREVYGAGKPPFDAHLLDPRHDGTGFEALTRSLMQRALIGLHTLTPPTDAGAWIDGLVRTRTRFTIDLRRYAEAFHHPDPECVRRFLTEPVFYDAQDAIIVLARAGADAGPASVPADAPRSLYGQALARAYSYVEAASRFFRHELSAEALDTLLDIGQPEIPTTAKTVAH